MAERSQGPRDRLARLPRESRNNDEIISKIDRNSGISTRSLAPGKTAKIGENLRIVDLGPRPRAGGVLDEPVVLGPLLLGVPLLELLQEGVVLRRLPYESLGENDDSSKSAITP